jgi:hypothetical protein
MQLEENGKSPVTIEPLVSGYSKTSLFPYDEPFQNPVDFGKGFGKSGKKLAFPSQNLRFLN